MTQQELFYRFGAALAIGILVGMERERIQKIEKHKVFAGMRTFAFMGLLGCLAASIADFMASASVFAVVVGILGALMVVAYSNAAREGLVGLTTEVSALVTILCGALCYWDQLPLAAALAVVTMALLSLKTEMHRIAHSITQEDIYATLKFAVITAIVLPVLPNRALGSPPFDVLNPYKVWLMVVLISGISFLGYILIKVVGPKLGVGLTGLLGGLASSTAVTLSLTERSHGKKSAGMGKPLALAIMLAWTIMFVRVVVAVGVLNVRLAQLLILPMGAALLAGVAYSAFLFFSQRSGGKENMTFSNPFELGPALKFGAIYAAVLLVARMAQMYLGDAGLYLSSAIAGLADADAIALSVAELNSMAGGPDAATATRAIVLAAMANTVAKGSIVLAGGSRTLRRALWPGMVIILATGIVVAVVL